MAATRRLLRSSSVFAPFLFVAIALSWSVSASAQTVGANVGGVITDPSGARLPGATVTLTNTANGATQTFITGPEGNYRAVALQPGPYTIKGELRASLRRRAR